MTMAFYMNCVSTHQLPLAKEVAKFADKFVYVYEGESKQAYQQASMDGLKFEVKSITEGYSTLETANLVYSGGMRPFDLFERRAVKGLKTFYASERWFKPIAVGECLRGSRYLRWLDDLYLPGWVRMFVPRYRRMVNRFVKWANTDSCAKVLAIGPWAKKDFLSMGVREEKLVDWGYYVAPNLEQRVISDKRKMASDGVLRVLWAGRSLAWKRVKDIEKAVGLANKQFKMEFTKLTGVTPEEVRKAMRNHDVYVLSSNAEEGWGAVLNEALEEGMNTIGTYEAGASAAMLPEGRLYHAGDVNTLARLLELEFEGKLPACSIGEWTAKNAAKRLMELV